MNCLAGSDDWQHSFGDRREDGSRYPVQLRVDGRGFARFHVDIAVGDEVLEPLEIVTGESWLGFGGVPTPSFPVISAEQQFAEKLPCVYAATRWGVNTRTKNLIDMVLLINGETLDKSKTAAAVRATFMKRATQDVPKELDPPPAGWKPVFAALATECDLATDLREGLNRYANSRRPLRPNSAGRL